MATRRLALALIGIALALALSATGVAAQGAGKPSVLLIHSNPRATPAAVLIEETLRAGIKEAYPKDFEIYSEFLDDEWASTDAYGPEQADFLRRKYGRRNVRVIVASAMTALDFAVNFRDAMFPGVPVVYIAVPEEALLNRKLPPDFVGRTVNLDPVPTLRLALRLNPGAKRLVVVVGATERDRVWQERVRAAVARLGEPLEAEYFAGLATSENARRLAALPSEAIVYTPGYFADGAGQLSVPRQAAEVLARASAVPVYGPFDTFVGTGAVGGSMTLFDQQAKDAAVIVAGLLSGDPVSRFATASNAQVPVVDWRALRRFGMDESSLPPGTIVRFREASLWQRYRVAASLTIGIVLIQAGLIGALLLQRYRRRRAEEASFALAGRLLTAHEDEHRRLARDLHDDVTQRLARLAIDAGRMEREAGSVREKVVARGVRDDLVRLSEDVHGLSYQLHPSVLDDLGLVEGLRAECGRVARQTPIEVKVEIGDVPARLPRPLSLCLFRVAQEALRNVVRHAQAGSITLSVVAEARGIALRVRDDGVGFDPEHESGRTSLGRVSMRERVRQVHGQLRIESAPGHGTTVTAWVPIEGVAV